MKLSATALTLILVAGLVVTLLFAASTQADSSPVAVRGTRDAVHAANVGQQSPLVTQNSIAPGDTALTVEICSAPEICATSFTIPAGKTFVAEHLSGWCNEAYYVGLRAGLNGQSFTHLFNTGLYPQRTPGVFNTMTRFYVSDRADILPVERGACGITVSGYLVTL